MTDNIQDVAIIALALICLLQSVLLERLSKRTIALMGKDSEQARLMAQMSVRIDQLWRRGKE